MLSIEDFCWIITKLMFNTKESHIHKRMSHSQTNLTFTNESHIHKQISHSQTNLTFTNESHIHERISYSQTNLTFTNESLIHKWISHLQTNLPFVDIRSQSWWRNGKICFLVRGSRCTKLHMSTRWHQRSFRAHGPQWGIFLCVIIFIIHIKNNILIWRNFLFFLQNKNIDEKFASTFSLKCLIQSFLFKNGDALFWMCMWIVNCE